MDFSAFKAYDIRGKYPDQINEDLAYLVGRAIVKYFNAKTVVVARDMRLSSPPLLASLIKGIIYGGADVINIGMTTTSMLNFALATYGSDAGVMVSASHNPGCDNAFKIINHDIIQLDESSGLNDLKKIIKHGFNPSEKTGSVISRSVYEEYLIHIKKCIGELPSMKIVVDYGNGVGAISASPTFLSYNLWVQELYPDPDGNFPNHPANPHDAENFNDLIAVVKAEKADLGIFFDGDADRALFVDDLGRIVPIDLLTVLLARQELRLKESGNVYYDLRFSKSVAHHIRNAGGNPVIMRVGNPFYKKVLREKGGIMGAEFAGHIMFPQNFNIDDGLFAALKTIKMISVYGKKLSELIDDITEYCDSPEISITAKSPSKVYKRVYVAFPKAKRIKLDGAYLDFPDGFISVRQSQSEPEIFRIRVEAKTNDVMTERLNKVKSIVAEG